MNVRQRRSNGARGFSLVELMVAITIGLFLLAGAVTIFTTSKRTYTEQEDNARMQESLRFAMEMIARDLRNTGYFGCAYNLDRTKLNNTLGAAAGTLLDTSFGPMEGLEGSAATRQWLPSNNAEITADIRAGTDAITVRHAGGPAWEVTGDSPPSAGADVRVDNRKNSYVANDADVPNNVGVRFGGDGQPIMKDDLVAVSNCGSADVFQASGATEGSGGKLSHAAALSSGYNTDSRASRATFVRYFIGTYTTPAGSLEPGLFRQHWDPATESVTTDTDTDGNPIPVVPGIENMQITYGIDTNDDDTVDQHVCAATGDDEPCDGSVGANLDDWNNVISVRIGLLARSLDANALEVDTNADRTLNGTALAAANDNRRRRTMETTVFIRNNSITIDRILTEAEAAAP